MLLRKEKAMLISSHEPKVKKQIGDMYKAREAVLSKSNLMLWHLVKSRYDWMNEYIYIYIMA